MHSRIHVCAKVLAGAVLASGLAACGSLSTNIAPDGSSAGQLTWPAPDRTLAPHKGGTYPTLTSLQRIHAGMSKNQIIALIGPPQFNEGFWQVRDWDYLFSLPRGDETVLCQYKILFDTHMLAQSFYWKPATCASLVNPPAVVNPKPAPAPQPEPQPQSFTLSADALFTFNSAVLQAAGRRGLDRIATEIIANKDHIRTVRIDGYTDHLGSAAYNLKLSQHRADAVRRYLQQRGVPGGLMTAVGRGESDPVKTTCDDVRSRKERIACLAPDRRVTIKVFGRR